MTNDISSKYQKLSEIEHVIARPGIYIGSIANTRQMAWQVEDNKMVEYEIDYNPGLMKLFDEIISNSVDEHIRSGNVTTIKVNTFPLTGEIRVEDNGGIPVVKHKEYGTYIPEMIFGELRTGSNFNDDDRMTAGMNGLGSKLTSIFSTYFAVDTRDGKKAFFQEFKDNLSYKSDPKITDGKNKAKGTKITFIPDYEKLGCTLDEFNLKKIKRRVYDVAGCNPGIKVFYNDKEIKINSFSDYVSMFSETFEIDITNDYEIALTATPDDGFKQVSFVNGIDTFNGGTHIDYVLNGIVAKIREFVKKKHKVDVKPNMIKQQLFLIMKCKVNAPSFTSQTKEFMSTEVRDYGTSYTPSDKFIKKLLSSEIVQKVLDWVEGEKRRNELAELRKLNKQTQNTNFLKRIEKFDDATSKQRDECTLFLTEGDSAAKAVLSSRNSKVHAVFPLRGKLLNVRDIEVKKLANNDEFQNIMAIIGLKIGQKVERKIDIRFGRIAVLSDQDPDGQHITGLFLNMLNEFWPELFDLGVVYKMNTPLIIATYRKKKYEFFSTAEYNKWAEGKAGHTKHYYKGLGGFSSKDFKEFLANEDQYLVQFTMDSKEDTEALAVAFDKSKADDRKEWLLTYNQSEED
jgi:DNA topoisomerase-2